VYKPGYGLDDRSAFTGRGDDSNFSLRHCVQTDSGAHPASHQIDTGGSSQGVKRPGHEADLSHPSGTEVKNTWNYTFTPPYVFVAWYLLKPRDKFTCTFTFLLCPIHAACPVHLILHDLFTLITFCEEYKL